MKERYCPTCSDRWSGAFTCELRCVTCGSQVQYVTPFEAGRRFAADVERMAEVGDE